jgi:hypothetical protein
LTPDPVIVARQAADTQHIRGYGVPTPPDDTIGTRYGEHQGPARILPAPACRPQGPALCLVDTATVLRSGEYEGEGDGGGIPDERITNWLVFAADQDSAQIFVISRQFASLWMSPASAEGFFIEHAINDASWIRARFGHAGTYIFSARISADDPIPYELRVAPVIATGASWPIGQSATLTIHADTSVAIVPAAMAAGLNADSTWARFAVWPREYRALLVRDTMYVACKLPCTQPQRFTMRPAQRVEINP